jgi:hypothetical protein
MKSKVERVTPQADPLQQRTQM